MIKATVDLLEPIHLATHFTPGPMAQTLEYIPGASLRGALAARYLNQPGADAEDARFRRWFLNPVSRFHPLLPLSSQEQQAYILPASAYTCKLFPGFKIPRSEEEHGIIDLLFEFSGPGANHHCRQAGCEAKLAGVKGFYWGRVNNEQLIQTRKRLITQTAVDSRFETAAPELLYTQEVLEEGQKFAGNIDLGDVEEEAEFSRDLLNNGAVVELRLGAARTRGRGLVLLTSELGKSAPLPLGRHGTLAEWLQTTDQEVRESKMAHGDAAGTYFSITFLTDAILLDPYLRFTNYLSAEHLARHVHPDLRDVICRSACVRTRLVDGWNLAHGLPKSTALAVEAGSCFLYQIDRKPADLAPMLAPLERDGLGERRVEGFGQATINHPFHFLRGGQA